MKYLCKCFRFLPLVLTFGSPLGFFITYGIAVGNDHVAWLWPYISDTGTLPPESCVFGLVLSFGSFLLMGIVYLRYRMVSELGKIRESRKVSRGLNVTSTTFGYLSAFGMAVVANFEETNQLLVHVIGALLAFGFGILYFITQTVITKKTDPSGRKMFKARCALSVLSVVFTAGAVGPIAPAFQNYKGDNVLKWTPEDGGYEFHLMSTFFEWFLMFSYCGFFLTLFLDFRRVKVIPPQIKFLDLVDEDSKTIESSVLSVVTIQENETKTVST